MDITITEDNRIRNHPADNVTFKQDDKYSKNVNNSNINNDNNSIPKQILTTYDF